MVELEGKRRNMMRWRSRFDEYRFRYRMLNSGLPPLVLRLTKFMFEWPALKKRFPDYRRQQAAVELPVDPLRCAAPPAVQLLVVVAEKDFGALPLCLAGALANSGNPISEIVVVTTAAGVDECSRIATAAANGTALSVLNEEDQLSAAVRSRLRARFGLRAGWVLQQLLTTNFVARSAAPGVLVVDADTVLLHPRLLLAASGQQLLTPTPVIHRPYYRFLNSIGMSAVEPATTFVAHFMLMQPAIIRGALSYAKCTDTEALAALVISGADRSETSGVCVEYELYAQYLLAHHPACAVLAKWGNTSARAEGLLQPVTLKSLSAQFDGWGSVSLHSYLA